MKLEYSKSETVVKREGRETFTTDAHGYTVVITRDRNGTKVSIYHPGADNLGRLGIVEFHPRSVSALAEFAKNAGDVIGGIAAAMSEAGLDDLRSDFDKSIDAAQERARQYAADLVKEQR